MFPYLLVGMILACLWRGLLPWLPVVVLLWPWVGSLNRILWRMCRAGHRWSPALVLVGFLLVSLRLDPLPEIGVSTVMEGEWGEITSRRGLSFSGGCRGYPQVVIRGLGEDSPAPGEPFRGEGILIPRRGSGRFEFRVTHWSCPGRETPATLASRTGKPDRRHRLTARLTRWWPQETRSLARALLLGDRSTLDYRLRRAFRRAGMAHVLALSGLHVGLFLILCSRLLLLAGMGPARAEYLLLLTIPLLPQLFGCGPSISRALMMAFHLLLVRRLGGRPRSLDLLASAAVLEIGLSPASLLQPGFQLSYVATLILIAGFRGQTISPQGIRLRLLFALKRGLTVSTACNLATLPVVILCFGRLPLTGPLVNILAAPLLAATLIGGWLSLPLAFFSAGSIATWPGATACAMLQGLAEIAGGSLAVVKEIPPPPLWSWLCWSFGFRRALTRGDPLSPDRLIPMLIPVISGLGLPFS